MGLCSRSFLLNLKFHQYPRAYLDCPIWQWLNLFGRSFRTLSIIPNHSNISANNPDGG